MRQWRRPDGSKDHEQHLQAYSRQQGRDCHRIRPHAALIAVAAIAAMQGVGTKLGTTFNNVSNKL